MNAITATADTKYPINFCVVLNVAAVAFDMVKAIRGLLNADKFTNAVINYIYILIQKHAMRQAVVVNNHHAVYRDMRLHNF
jgi:hypothetical protein